MLNLGLVSRRRALRFAGGGVLAAGLGAVAGTAAPANAARRIAAVYLDTYGVAAGRTLVGEAFGGESRVPQDLVWRIAQDFHAGRTLLLEGFLLSSSEVAACLLAAGVRPA